jgi:N-dimethylarginine dimethylaminohydrolase
MLLCPPDYFEVGYVINPWMSLDNPVDKAAATRQWNTFANTLTNLGVDVQLIDPQPGLSDMTFAGDGGIVYEKRFVPSNFRHEERRPEAEHYRKWFADRGYEIEYLPDNFFFEGLGDVTLNSGFGITSYGQRTSQDAIPHLEKLFPNVRWLATLELVDPRFFHIGVALQLIDDRTGMYVPDAFAAHSRAAIEKLPHDMIPVSDEDAERFAVNAVVVERDLVVSHCSPPLRGQLTDRNFNVHVVDVSEFLKSGGATRCLVLALQY